MNKFDLAILLKYIRTTVSQVRRHGSKSYVFFWHDADDLAWEHYILTDVKDANRPSQRVYTRDAWVTVESDTYAKALKNRKRIQVLLACQFLDVSLPSPQKLATIGSKSWLEFVRGII